MTLAIVTARDYHGFTLQAGWTKIWGMGLIQG